ncbi:MAG: Hsp70 family protein, partial [Candidatus Sumerlaeia bacterium]|nr:Hsp70 family protein [Candidatus Sumerlaeia bacterium]
AGFILAKLKAAAEQYLNEEVKYAVITVPAYYDDLQREATIRAAKYAGLEVVRLVNEPTAAAMAYGLQKKPQEVIAVYDFGGGTFDISILQVEKNTFEVLSTYGDTYLGGENIDNDLAELLAREFKERHHIDLTQDYVSFIRLKEAAEAAKCELSARTQTLISLPFITSTKKGVLHLERKIERSELEAIIQPYIQRTLECCEQALNGAALTTKNIDCVILVGGTTRIPAVRQAVAEFFGKQPVVGLNPDEIVAQGAAIQGGVLEGKLKEVVLLDITPHSLGIETQNNNMSVLIEKNSTIPIKASKLFTTTVDNQRFVNIHVLQGESPIASENRSLGKFTLTDLPEAPAGIPRIRVTFFINADGVIEVSAVELSSGIEKKITLVHSKIESAERTARRRERLRVFDPRRPKRGRVPEVQPTITRPGKEETIKTEEKAEGVPVIEKPEKVTSLDVDSTSVSTKLEPEFQFVEGEETKKEIAASVSIGEEKTTIQKVDFPSRKERFKLFSELMQEETLDISFSNNLNDALRRIAEDDVSSTAITKYQEALDELKEALARYPEAYNLYYLFIKMHLFVNGHKKALEVMEEIKRQKAIPPEVMTKLYDTVIQKFPSSLEARKLRAQFYFEQGLYDNSIPDLELLYEKERDTKWLRKITVAYEQILQETNDPGVKFRLVKVYFNLNEIDKAIELLQELVDIEEFRMRALKLLGLCLWQKKLYVKAWQKLKLLPLDEEMAELIYRLGKDMEDAEQLKPAVSVYQRLLEYREDYLDVKLRLKKINYRLKLQDDAASPEVAEIKEPRFLIIEEINRGSMGVIYKAQDIILDEIVAIKVLNESLLKDEQAVRRFKLEAKAAKRLSHPYIVRIHDFYESTNKKFLSMEYIEGKDLKSILAERKTLPEAEVIKYTLQICDALDYAHNIGVVHRDLKPANIMITQEGKIKITDFGIAKIVNVEEMTKAGTAIIGTPLYMAPEQILGGKIDARTDIYALGILM